MKLKDFVRNNEFLIKALLSPKKEYFRLNLKILQDRLKEINFEYESFLDLKADLLFISENELHFLLIDEKFFLSKKIELDDLIYGLFKDERLKNDQKIIKFLSRKIKENFCFNERKHYFLIEPQIFDHSERLALSIINAVRKNLKDQLRIESNIDFFKICQILFEEAKSFSELRNFFQRLNQIDRSDTELIKFDHDRVEIENSVLIFLDLSKKIQSLFLKYENSLLKDISCYRFRKVSNSFVPLIDLEFLIKSKKRFILDQEIGTIEILIDLNKIDEIRKKLQQLIDKVDKSDRSKVKISFLFKGQKTERFRIKFDLNEIENLLDEKRTIENFSISEKILSIFENLDFKSHAKNESEPINYLDPLVIKEVFQKLFSKNFFDRFSQKNKSRIASKLVALNRSEFVFFLEKNEKDIERLRKLIDRYRELDKKSSSKNESKLLFELAFQIVRLTDNEMILKELSSYLTEDEKQALLESLFRFYVSNKIDDSNTIIFQRLFFIFLNEKSLNENESLHQLTKQFLFENRNNEKRFRQLIGLISSNSLRSQIENSFFKHFLSSNSAEKKPISKTKARPFF